MSKKCILFGENELSKRIDDNMINQYKNIQNYVLNKNFLHLNKIDQNNFDDYFKLLDNDEFMPENNIKTLYVDSKKKCMEECFNESPKCKSFVYMNNDNDENKKILKNLSMNLNEHAKYTDCVNYKTKNYMELKQKYTELCQQKYGDEYMFDHNLKNNDSIISCDGKNKRAKCKLFFEPIEHFSNPNSNYKDIFLFVYIVFIFIFMLLISSYCKKK
jgi:hypothetical protein